MEHTNKESGSERPVGRRGFLGSLGLGILGAGGVLIAAAIARLPFPRIRNQAETVAIGKAVDFPFHRYTFVAACNVFVYRDREGIRVLSAVCTHLGCVLRSSEEGFHCPCHGSRFDRNGLPLSGPAMRPLEWYHAELARDGSLVVDLNRRANRNEILVLS